MSETDTLAIRTLIARRDMMIALAEGKPKKKPLAPLYTLSPLQKIGRLLMEMLKSGLRGEL